MDNEYLANIERIVEDYDANLYERDDFGEVGDRDSLDGIVVKYKKKYSVGINQKLSSRQKSFVSMHEVGHIATDTVGIIGNLICERMCDDWSINALIPDEKLEKTIDFYGDDWDGYASLFGVSQEVMDRKRKMYQEKRLFI